MRVARYCLSGLWSVVVGGIVWRIGSSGMGQIANRWAERAKMDAEYQARLARVMKENRELGMSNEHYAGVIGVNNRRYLEELCYGSSKE